MIYAIGIDPGSSTGLAVVTPGMHKPIIIYAATCRGKGIAEHMEAFYVASQMGSRIKSITIVAIQSPCELGRKMPHWNVKSPASLIKNAYISGLYVGYAVQRYGSSSVFVYPSQDTRGMKMPEAIFNAAFDNQTGKKLSEHARDAAILAAKALKDDRMTEWRAGNDIWRMDIDYGLITRYNWCQLLCSHGSGIPGA